MPKHYTENAKQVDNTLTGASSARLSGRMASGSVVLAQASYTMTGTEAVGDTINICHLPVGAVLVPHLSQIRHESLGTELSLSVGTQKESTVFSNQLDLKSNNATTFVAGAAALKPLSMDSGWVIATITKAIDPTESKKMQFWIAYVTP